MKFFILYEIFIFGWQGEEKGKINEATTKFVMFGIEIIFGLCIFLVDNQKSRVYTNYIMKTV